MAKKNYKRVVTDIADKLEYALKKGFTIYEACCYAQIPQSVYSDWIKINKDFALRMEYAKTALLRCAKFNIAEKIENGDLHESKYYVERKSKEEEASQGDRKSQTQNPFATLTTAQLMMLLGGEYNKYSTEQ